MGNVKFERLTVPLDSQDWSWGERLILDVKFGELSVHR